MKLTGSYQIKLERQKVWESLNDPEILKKTIPGCQEFKKNSDTNFTATAKNKIGPFNASFTGDIELKELNPPKSYKIVGSGNSPVGFASGEASVVLEDFEGGTKLTYNVEAKVGGKIAQVGSRLIDMTAKKMADIFFGKFSQLISNKHILNIEKTDSEKEVITKDIISREKNLKKKVFIYFSLVILATISIYLFS